MPFLFIIIINRHTYTVTGATQKSPIRDRSHSGFLLYVVGMNEEWWEKDEIMKGLSWRGKREINLCICLST